jgi:hypothetical protein
VSFTGGTFTTSLISTTALATPSALGATQFTAFASTVSGAAVMGFGTTNDVALMNRAGTVVLGIGPNTTAVNLVGLMTFVTSVSSVTAFATPSALGATTAIHFASTVSGHAIMGYGTTNDVSLMNRAGTVVLGIGPNTTAVNMAGTLAVTGAFGCNAATAQTAYASGGALAGYGAGANGLDTGANMSALHAMVVSIRAALVANGIMS